MTKFLHARGNECILESSGKTLNCVLGEYGHGGGIKPHEHDWIDVKQVQDAKGDIRRKCSQCGLCQHITAVPLHNGFDIRIGKWLKNLRKQHGFSQAYIGEILDVSFQMVQKYEKGAALSLDKFTKLCQFFNVDPSAVLLHTTTVVIGGGGGIDNTNHGARGAGGGIDNTNHGARGAGGGGYSMRRGFINLAVLLHVAFFATACGDVTVADNKAKRDVEHARVMTALDVVGEQLVAVNRECVFRSSVTSPAEAFAMGRQCALVVGHEASYEAVSDTRFYEKRKK